MCLPWGYSFFAFCTGKKKEAKENVLRLRGLSALGAVGVNAVRKTQAPFVIPSAGEGSYPSTEGFLMFVRDNGIMSFVHSGRHIGLPLLVTRSS